MQINRLFTAKNVDVFSTVEWATRSSKIANLDGSVVFETNDARVPADWSQLATDIMVSKYFRKAGVPQVDEDGDDIVDDDGNNVTGPEKSARQVIHRLAGCWRHWGEENGYFDSTEDAQAFYDETCHMMLNQMVAPNSPQWFNTGLNWAYGISGPSQGHWVNDPNTGDTQLASDAYTHPQPHACFIQSVKDDLVNENGIMDLWTREARLFKYGSGTGTNFSTIRGGDEPLAGGGTSSGLMSFLKIGDRAAGVIKSGGTTRRAAKMVCLDMDHPDIEEFVNWKVREEIKVDAMVEGLKHLDTKKKEYAARIGLKLDFDFNGESYQTVSGQNSNNSVRISNDFFKCLNKNGQWELIRRTDGSVHKTISATDLWDQIAYAAWRCADPGVQFDTTINQWHTCPESGRINASNPCSEYMFLDDTACNLASLNLLKFYDSRNGEFDVKSYEHSVRLWTIVLEISVLMAAFPSKEIASRSYQFRTLGLGYANLGAMLMQAGIPYDSDEGRAICGSITALTTGVSYETSSLMAKELGPFSGYEKNKNDMMSVMRNHRRAANGVSGDHLSGTSTIVEDYEGVDIRPVIIREEDILDNPNGMSNGSTILRHARYAWDRVIIGGTMHGFRNAQVSVIAPTGTIGLLMDCDTTGVEPDFSLVKFKKLAGGGYFKIVNQSIKPALINLGYNVDEIKAILRYIMGGLHLNVTVPDINGVVDMKHGRLLTELLFDAGLSSDVLDKVIEALPKVFELGQAFNMNTMGTSGQDFLQSLGLNEIQIEILNRTICGTQTVEGAPHLKPEHLSVFDCANTCGPTGKRFIAADGHIRMMAAAQPFLSGAISKTINLPNTATVDDIKNAYILSWELGIKAVAIYRDGCKLSQPLNSKSDTITEEIDNAPKIVEKIVEKIIERPLRRRLPDTRNSITHKFNVAGHEGYLTVGLYDDGAPGEMFIAMAKEGSTIGGVMDSLGVAISVALQYGVPVESLVTKFAHQRFEPSGMTHNLDIPFAKSLVDYIFRWMGMQFIEGYRDENAPKRDKVQSVIPEWPKKNPPLIAPPTKIQNEYLNGDDAVASQMIQMQADAPACDVCGTITIRSGNCYKCLNCGNSLGCS